MKSPGQRIKEERETKNWSQQQLADEITKIKKEKISRAAVAQWENGNSKTQKPENLFAAATALGLLPKWVLFGLGDKRLTSAPGLNATEASPRNSVINTGDTAITVALTPEQRQILSLMESISDEDRKAWLKLGASLAKSNKSVVNDLPKPQSAHGVNEEPTPVESASGKSWPEVERREKDVGHKPDRRRRHSGFLI